MAVRVMTVMMTIFAIGFITACVDTSCPEPAQYYLRDISTHALDVNSSPSGGQQEYFQTDTLTNQLAFKTVAQIEFAALERQNYGLMNTAYGCVDNELLNPINPEWSSLSTNKEIAVRDATLGPPQNTIPPHTNLLNDERIQNFIKFPADLAIEEEAITEIDVTALNIIEGDYTFYFKWVTQEGLELTDSIQVYLNM